MQTANNTTKKSRSCLEWIIMAVGFFATCVIAAIFILNRIGILDVVLSVKTDGDFEFEASIASHFTSADIQKGLETTEQTEIIEPVAATEQTVSVDLSTVAESTSADTSIRSMVVKIRDTCLDKNKVGGEWKQTYFINGESISSGSYISLSVGETIQLKAQIVEEDTEFDDVGKAIVVKSITQEDLDNGFEVSFEVVLKENDGAYRGRTQVHTVTFKFSS